MIKEKSGRKKLTKRERDQLGMKERQLNMAFVAKLKEAACDDKVSS